MKTPLILSLGLLLLAGCSTRQIKGRLINLDSGEETLVDARWTREGSLLLQGDSATGRRAARGELWEVRTVQPPVDAGEAGAYSPGDTVFHGSGFLREGGLILDIHYHRPQESSTAVGTATDNRGGRYKAVFWKAGRPKDLKPAGP